MNKIVIKAMSAFRSETGKQLPSVLANLNVEDVKVGNTSKVDTLFKDMQKYEFINFVRLGERAPAEGDWGDIVLTDEWAMSFAKAVNEVPAPLYLRGHENAGYDMNKKRAIPSGYVVGAELRKEGEDSFLLLRNRLFERKEEASKEIVEQTLRELKAGTLETSTGDLMRISREFDEDTMTWNSTATLSLGRQTNAIVEYDQGATDNGVLAVSFKGNAGDKTLAVMLKDGSCITALDGAEENIQGESTMKKEEMLKNLCDARTEKVVTEAEIFNALGVKAMSEEEKTRLEHISALEKSCGKTIDELASEHNATVEADFTSRRDKYANEHFTNDVVRGVATAQFKLTSGTDVEIEAEFKRITEQEAMKKLVEQMASNFKHGFGSGEESGGNDNEFVVR